MYACTYMHTRMHLKISGWHVGWWRMADGAHAASRFWTRRRPPWWYVLCMHSHGMCTLSSVCACIRAHVYVYIVELIVNTLCIYTIVLWARKRLGLVRTHVPACMLRLTFAFMVLVYTWWERAQIYMYNVYSHARAKKLQDCLACAYVWVCVYANIYIHDDYLHYDYIMTLYLYVML